MDKCHLLEDFLREVSLTHNQERYITEVNVELLNRFENGTEVTAELLKSTGAITKIEKDGIKNIRRRKLLKEL